MMFFNFKKKLIFFLFFFLNYSLYAGSILSLVNFENSSDLRDINNKIKLQQINKEFYSHPKLEKLQNNFLEDSYFIDGDNFSLSKNNANRELVLLLGESLNLLLQSKNYEAYLLLKKFPKITIQKNSLFESYYFLLSYLSFDQGFYQDNYQFSKNYLEYFSNYQGVYPIFYFHLYSALITKERFYFFTFIAK